MTYKCDITSTKHESLESRHQYTGWSKTNATPVVCNFNNIINKMSLLFISLGRNSFPSKMTPRSTVWGKAFDSRTSFARQCNLKKLLHRCPKQCLKQREIFARRHSIEYATGGRSSLPLRCLGCRFTRNHCACAPMLCISELCEDCPVASEIDYEFDYA